MCAPRHIRFRGQHNSSFLGGQDDSRANVSSNVSTDPVANEGTFSSPYRVSHPHADELANACSSSSAHAVAVAQTYGVANARSCSSAHATAFAQAHAATDAGAGAISNAAPIPSAHAPDTASNDWSQHPTNSGGHSNCGGVVYNHCNIGPIVIRRACHFGTGSCCNPRPRIIKHQELCRLFVPRATPLQARPFIWVCLGSGF